MAEDANYPFAYSKYHGQGVERKVRVVIIYGIELYNTVMFRCFYTGES